MTASVRTDGVPDEAKGALSSWRDGPAKKAILGFVATACGQDGVLAAHAEREFAYTPGAELALEQAAAGWTTVSVRDDWATVF